MSCKLGLINELSIWGGVLWNRHRDGRVNVSLANLPVIMMPFEVGNVDPYIHINFAQMKVVK